MATTSIGLARYARDYFEAAKAADDVIGNKSGYEIIAPPPVMFLTAHAIELGFKAYLLNTGENLSSLKKLGHDLIVLWNVCSNNNINSILVLNKEELGLLELISDLHVSTELRYIDTGFKTVPVFGPLENLVSKILDAVCLNVGYR
jgi:hypothetical protein